MARAILGCSSIGRSYTRPLRSTSPTRAFFSGWAGVWPQQQANEATAQLAAASVYPPGQWRVNGPLYNLAGFGEAYACKAGSAMQANADERLVLWPAVMPAVVAPVAPAKTTKAAKKKK